MKSFLSCALAFACLFCVPLPATAANVAGSVASQSVIWLSGAGAPAPVQVEMRNLHRAFEPPVLIVPRGSNVRFPNGDMFYHSVYSSGGDDAFDIGYYLEGPGKLVTFWHPGIVQVRCHIHPSMHGVIVVVDGPWQAGAQGYRFTNVRPGTYVLHVWNQSTERETSSRVRAR